MNDILPAIAALRESHDALSRLLESLPDGGLSKPSYASGWTVAQVLSHLGSQAEIYALWLEAGVRGADPPGNEVFVPIWQAWDAKAASVQAADSLTANEALVTRLESLNQHELASFRLELFGSLLDARDLTIMRLAEHSVHSWDIAVAFDDAATILPSSVELVVDTLPRLAAGVGKPAGRGVTIAVATSAPTRLFTLSPHSVALEPGHPTRAEASLEISAEALIRLVYGRLDHAHTPPMTASGVDLDLLRQVFPGL